MSEWAENQGGGKIVTCKCDFPPLMAQNVNHTRNTPILHEEDAHDLKLTGACKI